MQNVCRGFSVLRAFSPHPGKPELLADIRYYKMLISNFILQQFFRRHLQGFGNGEKQVHGYSNTGVLDSAQVGLVDAEMFSQRPLCHAAVSSIQGDVLAQITIIDFVFRFHIITRHLYAGNIPHRE